MCIPHGFSVNWWWHTHPYDIFDIFFAFLLLLIYRFNCTSVLCIAHVLSLNIHALRIQTIKTFPFLFWKNKRVDHDFTLNIESNKHTNTFINLIVLFIDLAFLSFIEPIRPSIFNCSMHKNDVFTALRTPLYFVLDFFFFLFCALNFHSFTSNG